MITRQQAWDKVNELIKIQNLVKHCLAVECAMRAYYDYFGVEADRTRNDAERELWGIAGLVHDADWEAFPDEHPGVIVEWLREQGASDDVINAVEAHVWEFGIEAKSLMAKTLRACDELTGLIVAVTLVKDRHLANVTVESVLNKWKKKEFARGVKREDIERGAEEIGVPVENHIEVVLEAMKRNAESLGL